jgi:hypothetical protein
MLITIVGPSAELISGSLLRPLNIYYSLKGFRNLKTRYVPIKGISDLFLQFRCILHADIIITSGVNPWVSASIAMLGKVLKKRVVIDFHGFAWFEAYVTKATGFFMRTLLLISERVSYKFSRYVITASRWLANVLTHYFGERKCVFIIENAVPYIFEKVADRLMKNYNSSMLRKYVCEKVLHRSDYFNKLLFIAPLPSIFKSNILAYEELLKLRRFLNENMLIVVTGIRGANILDVSSNIISIGYIGYVDYVALLLSSEGVILPYPNNAICGGIRNKVLEAGFCRKLVVSTKMGMMHVKASPNMHYILMNSTNSKNTLQNLKKEVLESIIERLSNLIKEEYSFHRFRESITKAINTILLCQP